MVDGIESTIAATAAVAVVVTVIAITIYIYIYILLLLLLLVVVVHNSRYGAFPESSVAQSICQDPAARLFGPSPD